MKKLVVMVGLPGSGKSTVRKRLYADLVGKISMTTNDKIICICPQCGYDFDFMREE